MQKIHHKILDVLEQIGFADAIPSTIEYMTKAGAYIDKADGRMKFPRATSSLSASTPTTISACC